MSARVLEVRTPKRVSSERRFRVDGATLTTARSIVESVAMGGESALREHAERFGDVTPGAPLVLSSEELEEARAEVAPSDLALLERTADRIRRFALAQRASLSPVEIPFPGGTAGQFVAPVELAGCYAPGGRFPLPSSVLMTAVTARAAGVEKVWVASPRPAAITRAAAAVAGADGLLAVGGAQAIAALAYGVGVPACDAIVGPGNRFVTAAKQVVSGRVRIDMLAGPSELCVLADDSADPATVAADLLGQAEHDPDASVILVSTSSALVERVERELVVQLATLPTAEIARGALRNSYAVVVDGVDEGVAVCDLVAPEHLEVHTEEARRVAARCRHYGALFIGHGAAEVFGDYGAGPNHTLPTGGTARHLGGLSVFDFLRVRTYLTVDDPAGAWQLVEDAQRLADLEGLAAHGRAAARRRS